MAISVCTSFACPVAPVLRVVPGGSTSPRRYRDPLVKSILKTNSVFTGPCDASNQRQLQFGATQRLEVDSRLCDNPKAPENCSYQRSGNETPSDCIWRRDKRDALRAMFSYPDEVHQRAFELLLANANAQRKANELREDILLDDDPMYALDGFESFPIVWGPNSAYIYIYIYV